jgi:TetR/AcrR family transcriptional regulator, mexJK operon transcriptional repressor
MVTKCRLPRSSPCERRDHIVAVATQAFADEGFAATSMSSIAAQVGGSKATLYKYFPSKEDLFEAVMEQRCERILAPLRELRDSDEDDLESLLVQFGESFLTKIYEPAALDVYRMIHSECTRFPDLAPAFFRSGPDVAIEGLRAALERFARRGQIECDDIQLAAGQFMGMLRGDRHMRHAVGIAPPATHEEIVHDVRLAARIFAQGLRPR